METNNKETDVVEIDLLEILNVLWHRVFLIVLVSAFAAAAVYIFETFFVTPQYTSTTEMLVLARQTEGTLSSGDITTSTSLTQDYVELIQTREVTEETVARLGLVNGSGQPMTHAQLLDKIDVEQLTSTRIIKISVKDPSPQMAQQIADTVRELAAEHIKNVTDTEAVNVADYANLPIEPSSPHLFRDAILGGAVGFVVICAIILIGHLSDNTIKTSEDVERYLGVSTLGTIPIEDAKGKSKKSRRNKR